ncbi:MAG: hypothetical protein ACLFNM_03905 [Candidatus Woesearchaeota archaeon]
MKEIFDDVSFSLRNYHMYGQYVNDVVLENKDANSLEINVLTSMPSKQKRLFVKDCLSKISKNYARQGYGLCFNLYNTL